MKTCEFDNLTEGGVCIHCGYTLKRRYTQAPNRRCRPPLKVSLVDTVVRDGVETEVRLYRPACVHIVKRTGGRAKGGCGSGVFLPIYECSLFKRCSPFGKVTDPDIIHPCQGCDRYEKTA